MKLNDIVRNLEVAGVAHLAREIAKRRGMTLAGMWERRRQRFQSHARQEFWAVLRGTDPVAWSYPRIGDLSGHDHTTVMSGERKHLDRVAASMSIGALAKTTPPAAEKAEVA